MPGRGEKRVRGVNWEHAPHLTFILFRYGCKSEKSHVLCLAWAASLPEQVYVDSSRASQCTKNAAHRLAGSFPCDLLSQNASKELSSRPVSSLPCAGSATAWLGKVCRGREGERSVSWQWLGSCRCILCIAAWFVAWFIFSDAHDIVLPDTYVFFFGGGVT